MPALIKQSGEWGSIVRRIKRKKPTRGIDWRTMVRRIKTGKCTPIISYQVSGHHFTKQDQVVENWASELYYPLADAHDLPQVARFASINSRDILSVKEDYIEFLKLRLIDKARIERGEDDPLIYSLEDEMYDLTFSEVAVRLGYPRYEDEFDDPLRLLAELPLPIYLTTNYCTFMETALKAAGKNPQTEICYWHDVLDDEDTISVFTRDPDYQPTIDEPLVFHLHGLDAYPSSLVLTQDEYYDFLIKIAGDTEAIPRRITQALADSSLLLLGYQFNELDFMTIFRGLITSQRINRRLLSLSIQYDLTEKNVSAQTEVQDYLQKYFNKANFDVYWGDTQSFMQELWEHWES